MFVRRCVLCGPSGVCFADLSERRRIDPFDRVDAENMIVFALKMTDFVMIGLDILDQGTNLDLREVWKWHKLSDLLGAKPTGTVGGRKRRGMWCACIL